MHGSEAPRPAHRLRSGPFRATCLQHGPVIPKFRERSHAAEPLTVTHPEVTRYFMSIPEAAQLVLQAG